MIDRVESLQVTILKEAKENDAESEWKDRTVSADFSCDRPFDPWLCLVRDIRRSMSVKREDH